MRLRWVSLRRFSDLCLISRVLLQGSDVVLAVRRSDQCAGDVTVFFWEREEGSCLASYFQKRLVLIEGAGNGIQLRSEMRACPCRVGAGR